MRRFALSEWVSSLELFGVDLCSVGSCTDTSDDVQEVSAGAKNVRERENRMKHLSDEDIASRC